MKIENQNILFLAQYAAPYEGNFLASLMCLEALLKSEHNCNVAYVFPKFSQEQKWYDKFSQKHLTFTTRNDVQNASAELVEIKNKYKPNIVHTHFDGYDIVVKRVFGSSAKIIWHMHNHLSFLRNPFKALYQLKCFWFHYGYESKNVSIISVSKDMANFAAKWQKVSMHSCGLIAHIPNGIDLKRVINQRKRRDFDGTYRFLAFGGRNSDKRIDVLLKASEKLRKKCDKFQIVITKGTDTENIINDTFENKIPSWLVLRDQTQDIVSLFNSVDCFVSSSCHETFSYSVCEASVFGLPIIQSDIKGTLWNAKNPSVKLFHVNDINDLCEKMFLQMNEDRNDLEKSLKITIDNNMRDYSLEQWACNIINFYKKI